MQCWWCCLLRPMTCICEGDSPERAETSRQRLKNEYWNIHRWREHKVLLCAAGFRCFFKILFWEMFRGKHLSWHGSHLMKSCMLIYLLALFLVFALWLSGSATLFFCTFLWYYLLFKYDPYLILPFLPVNSPITSSGRLSLSYICETHPQRVILLCFLNRGGKESALSCWVPVTHFSHEI